MRKLPGITREEEEAKLRRTIAVAEAKVEENRRSVLALAEELHAMQEDFDESDKEAQTLWHATDARFKFVNQDLRRAEQARKKPYFGRIDFRDSKIGKDEVYYIGRSVIADNPAEPEVIDWRAPIASVYYDSAIGKVTYSVKGEGRFEIDLTRKRTYEIENDKLKDFYDSDVVANDELLTKYLARNKRAVLGEIIATIQQEQNEVIRKKPQHNLIVQGAAGSGKTTVAMHRISYILYNYELEFAPEDFYIIGSNQVLLNYITGVLPELNVYGVAQMTMEQLFVRLLYEAWDKNYKVVPVRRGVTPPVKGTLKWFRDLEQFCDAYERSIIPRGDVCIEKNGVLLLSAENIQRILEKSEGLSRADKITRLTENLLAKLENEISGKYYSYTASEKQKLTKYYETYFGKREWKGSIYDLYDAFLTEQNAKGFQVSFPEFSFDVYDLAALAYLYKRIQEDQVIREAGHVVIDEAQDFGMMAYASLKYCLSKCTYTIMGDVSQNISMDYGLNDWKELRELILPGDFDYFGLLRKSYRNTVEISNFATDILYHGSFQIYPVEPIIRHGKEVRVTECKEYEALLKETERTLQGWLENGMETIAVVCADEDEVVKVTADLEGKVPLIPVDAEHMEFTEGVMVLSLEYTKGLEFDAVLLFDVSEEKYPVEDGYVKRLYVAATRALHELVVLYRGKLTGLIAEPVPEERKKKAVVKVGSRKKAASLPEDQRTNEEIYRDRATEGEAERRLREQYGPRHIEIGKSSLRQGQDAIESLAETRRGSVDVSNRGTGRNGQSMPGGDIPTGKAAGRNTTLGGLSGGTATGLHQMYSTGRFEVPKEEKKGVTNNVCEFGEMPDNAALQVPGHSKIDCSVRISMKGQGCYDILSGYGTLHIQPVAADTVRICFVKGQCSKFPDSLPALRKQGGKYRVKENPAMVEIATEKLAVQVEKRTGIVRICNAQGKLLLEERNKDSRLIAEDQAWEFFTWGKDEALLAKGVNPGETLKIGASAKYISYGPNSDELPSLASSKGYEIIFPPRTKVLCCNIPMYGTYVREEQTALLEYYIRVK